MLDFTAAPAIVRAIVEGERLSLGHLVNPAFAAELARIDPLPHSGWRSISTCCRKPGCDSCWPTTPGPAKPSWPGCTFARCCRGA